MFYKDENKSESTPVQCYLNSFLTKEKNNVGMFDKSI